MKKKNFLITALILFNIASMVAQSLDLESIDSKLTKIYNDDQQVRKKVLNAYKNSSPNIRDIITEKDSIDSYNQHYIANILDVYGWPNNLSDQANKAIWIIIDHANNSFAEKYFPLVKEKGKQGILLMADVATLEDRISMRNNKKQKYGTQTVGVLSADNAESIIYIWPIENNEKVDGLRASVGLPSMEQYIQTVKEHSNSKVVWDKEISPDRLKDRLPKLHFK